MRSPAAALCAALATAIAAALAVCRRRKDESATVQRLESELAAMTELRLAERAGRTRAEKRLRELQGGKQAPAPSDAKGAETVIAYPLRPIGTLHSVFSQRNGTPRQPLLVPLARARLKLRAGIPRDCLQGLEGYSHCWLLYVFHENTDLARLWRAGPDADRGLKGKVISLMSDQRACAFHDPDAEQVGVPRLNGGRMGVLATRSPHRPCPIGLSVAEIVAVDGDAVTLAGADVVDGTPVLDVKPYLPFADGVPGATAPPWVANEAPDEPLRMAAVDIPPAAVAAISACWQRSAAKSGLLYASADALLALVRQACLWDANSFWISASDKYPLAWQALGRDIRSVYQRLHVGPRVSMDSASAPATKPQLLDEQAGGNATAAAAEQPAPSSAMHPAASASGTNVMCPVGHESASADADEKARDQSPAEVLQTPAFGYGSREPGDTQSRTADLPGRHGVYHVVLDGLDISYDIANTGVALVRTAIPWQRPATA